MTIEKGLLWSLLFAAMLCIGSSAAQNNETANLSVKDAASDLGLATFSAALESAGLTNTLNDKGVLLIGGGSFAVFAPSDEAFARVTELDMNSTMENQTELRRILGYHIVWNSGLFENISDVSSVQTLEGENLTLNSSEGQKVNGANITATRKYGSGTIYVIDRVLIPKKSTSQGVVNAANDLGAKKFASAVKAAGLSEVLDGQGPAGIGALSEGPFTVFAPSDAAYDKAKATLDSIAKKDAGTRTLLSYHIVDAKALLNKTDFNSVKTLSGDSIAIDVSAGNVGGAKVLKSERYDNGIIYVIDQVLVPIRLSM
jgi:transforming growth factor-beta-induced protein